MRDPEEEIKTEVRAERNGKEKQQTDSARLTERRKVAGSVGESIGDQGLAPVSERVEQTGFELVGNPHFAGQDDIGRRALETELAEAERTALVANRRTEDTAGDGTGGIDGAAARIRVERRTDGIVGEVLEALAVSLGGTENAGGRIAGEIGGMDRDPGESTLTQSLSADGIVRREPEHVGAETGDIERIDGKGPGAALIAARAAGEPIAGLLRGIGQGGVEDLNELAVAGGKHGTRIHDCGDSQSEIQQMHSR